MVTGGQNKAIPSISLGPLPQDGQGYNQGDVSSNLASPSEACMHIHPRAPETSKTLVLELSLPPPIFQHGKCLSFLPSPWLPTSGINVLLMAASEF